MKSYLGLEGEGVREEVRLKQGLEASGMTREVGAEVCQIKGPGTEAETSMVCSEAMYRPAFKRESRSESTRK